MWLFLGIAAAVWTQTCAENSAEQGKGVLFNWQRTVLLAERFEQVEFVVPLPFYSTNVAEEIAHAGDILEQLWNKPTFDCDLTGTQEDQDSRTNQIIAEVTTAHEATLAETASLAEEIQRMLATNSDPDHQSRQRRFIPAVAVGALATTVLGLGLGIGASESCLLHGAFGTCSKKQIRANRADIDRALKLIQEQGQRWTQVVNEINDKFYLVATQMEQIQDLQVKMANQQEEFWNATEEALDILSNNTKLLRECQEYLYIRNQANHIRTTVLAELGLLYTNIKAYRAALWAYRATLLGAIAPLSRGQLPIALVDRKSLEAIMAKVGAELLRDDERLTLAIPLSEPLAYYEADLVRQVTSTDAGLVITLAVPLTTRELVLDVYEAITLPMPNDDGTTATRWRLEAPLIAISRSHKESAILDWRQLDQCVGTDKISICARGFATTRARDACLTTLYYHGPEAAVAACPIDTITLPQTEQATNLGHGRWLLTSQSADYEFQRLHTDGGHRTMDHVQGCRACVITLECGTELETDRLYLKADSASCEETGARRLDLKLSTPLAELFQLISVNDTLPQFPNPTVARAHLAERTRTQLGKPLEPPSRDQIKMIAEPIVADFRHERPGIPHENQHVGDLARVNYRRHHLVPDLPPLANNDLATYSYTDNNLEEIPEENGGETGRAGVATKTGDRDDLLPHPTPERRPHPSTSPPDTHHSPARTTTQPTPPSPLSTPTPTYKRTTQDTPVGADTL